MKLEVEVTYDPARHGVTLFLSRTALLALLEEAFELKPPPIPEVEVPRPPR